jgi:hypothetical protein
MHAAHFAPFLPKPASWISPCTLTPSHAYNTYRFKKKRKCIHNEYASYSSKLQRRKLYHRTKFSTLQSYKGFIRTLFSYIFCGEGVYRAISYEPRHDGTMKHQKEEVFASVHDRF